MSDAGVGAWIQTHITDSRIRITLLVMVALLIVGNLMIRFFTSAPAMLEAVLLELVLFYAAMLVVVASIAVFPIGDQSSARQVAAAERAQKNARGSLALLVGSGIALVLVVEGLIVPFWSAISFEFQYQRLNWGLQSLSEFFDSAPIIDPRPDDPILSLSESELPVTIGGRVPDPRSLLRLVGRRDELEVANSLDLRSERHTAAIASRRVTFKRGGSIQLGSSNLLILTQSLTLENRRASASDLSQIFAFKPDDVPSNGGLNEGEPGRGGAPAGNVTIVVLGSIVGPERLFIDLRGQRGGQGADGQQPPPTTEVGSGGANASAELSWSFRKPTNTELEILRNNFAKELQAVEGDSAKTKKIQGYLEDFNRCVGSAAPCKFMLCDDQSWNPDGHDGPKGAMGSRGGKGGPSGNSGNLRIFFLDTSRDQQLRSKISLNIVWADGKSIEGKQPSREQSQGGAAGTGGAGGRGGLGLAGDAMGACRAGKNGQTGPIGPPGSNGDQGNPGDHGPPASIEKLLGMANPYGQ